MLRNNFIKMKISRFERVSGYYSTCDILLTLDYTDFLKHTEEHRNSQL